MSVSPQEGPRQRLGLALSGGGFRAALFHVGVLARLGELGMLRRVETLSTVSGGSIVGALYYLHVRDLLQTKADADVTDDDYLDIVADLEETFLRGVKRNVRGLAFRDLAKNFRMATENYSRSDRLGELYDEVFYRPAWNKPLFGAPPPEPRTTMIEMRELLVAPAGEGDDFNPVRDNGRRRAPVPILMINATSLNTGHNWRFEAVGMGEPDFAEVGIPEEVGQVDPREDARREIDRNTRLRWTRYSQLDEHQARFELGLAVAASACVPTLFHPLPVTRLFELPNGDPVNVQLVDGGVHDNQGIAGLIDFKCSPIIVSDASGFFPDQADPPTRVPAVGGRSLGLYGDRVREEQLISARLEEDERPLALMHLRKGILGFALAPKGRDGKPLEKPRPQPPEDFRGERFGIAQRVQECLSKVRTDLDSFSEIEAYSLMVGGYRQTGPNIDQLQVGDSRPSVGREWRFDAVAAAAEAGEHDGYCKHLAAASSRFGKAIRLSWPARLLALGLAAAAVLLLVVLLLIDGVRGFFAEPIPVWVVLAILGAVLLLLVLYLNRRLPRPLRVFSDLLYTQVFPALLALPLWLASLLTLVFSRMFLDAGRVERVLGRPQA